MYVQVPHRDHVPQVWLVDGLPGRTGEARPWMELLQNGTFLEETLAEEPTSFMTDQVYLDLLVASGEKHGYTWLHHLHLGIGATQAGDEDGGQAHFHQSLLKNQTVLALHLAKQGHTAWTLAQDRVKAVKPALNWNSTSARNLVSLARDVGCALVTSLCEQKQWAQVQHIIDQAHALPIKDVKLSQLLLSAQPWNLAQAKTYVYGPAPNATAAEFLLLSTKWAVSTPDLVPLYADVQYMLQAEKMGVADWTTLNSLQRREIRRKNKTPSRLDFRGAT